MPNAEYKSDRDGGFVGVESRTNPVLLKEQFLQYAQNIRLERGIAQARKGNKRMNNDDVDGRTVRYSAKFVTSSGEEKIALICHDSLGLYDPATDDYSTFYSFGGRTISATDSVAAVQAVNKLYIFRGLPSHEPRYAKFVYTGHPSLTVTVTEYSDAGRTIPINHGYTTGDEVIISDCTEAVFKGSYVITVTSSTSFTYQLSATHASKTLDCLVTKAKAPLLFDGSSVTVVPQGVISGTAANMPPSDTAIYQGNRIILKQGRDKLAVSDYLDFNTFDLTFGQFTINLGAYDELIGFTPWLDNEFIIFQRNSIYKGRVVNSAYVTGDAPESQSYITSISNSFGCVGKRAIVNTGRFVFFLSDGGIYMLEPQLDLKTINTLEPLSAPINDLLLQYNREYLNTAHGVFFDNRLFMALPVGNDQDGNPHQRPNKVFIFNILNKAWESIDTYPVRVNTEKDSRNFYADSFEIVNYGSRKRLFIVNNGGGRAAYYQDGVWVQPPSGGVYLCEETEEGDQTDLTGISVLPAQLKEDDPATPLREYGFWLKPTGARVYTTDSRITTRRFTLGVLFEKRFSSVSTDLTLPTGGSVKTTVEVLNPDKTMEADFYSTTPEPDATRRVSIAQRGYACQVQYQFLSGRPAIRGVTIDATLTGRNLVSKS
jgi:hypothetical protein